MMLFVAEETRNKFTMVRSSREVAKQAGVPLSSLPSALARWED